MQKIKELKFNKQQIKFHWRDDADLSVIDEVFVDRMYHSVENIILNTKYCILDVGAHIGCFSVYARLFNPQVKIIALEPEPNNFNLLKENLKLNGCKNVTVKQLALSPTTPEPLLRQEGKTATLYLNQDSHNHSTFYKTENSIEVPATTLEKIIRKNKLTKIGLLKMDIEGGEFDIIKSTIQNTWNKIQNIAVEYHELCTTRVQSKFENNKRADLENIIRSHGFSVEHFPNHFDKRFGLLLGRNKK